MIFRNSRFHPGVASTQTTILTLMASGSINSACVVL
jgi:hypothetical protein